MIVKVFSFNIQENKLSDNKKKFLKLLKLESKLYYNHLITESQIKTVDDFGNLLYPNNIFEYDTKSNWIKTFDYDTKLYGYYELATISSQIKQAILTKIQSSIKGLSAAKSKGRKVGKLKFKSIVNVPFKQLNNTYYLSDDAKNLSIQGAKKLKLHLVPNKNLNKLSKNLGLGKVSLKKLIDLKIIDIANAEIVSENNKDKLNVTVYLNTESLKIAGLFQGAKLTKEQKDFLKDTKIGIDAGIKSELIINTNDQYCAIEVDSRKQVLLNKKQKKQLKYQRQFNRHISKSKKHKKVVSNTPLKVKPVVNEPAKRYAAKKDVVKKQIQYSSRNNESGFRTKSYFKIKSKIDKIQLNINNQKIDGTNKLFSLLKECKQVTFQDENIKAWHHNKPFKFSGKIQKGILGKLYAKLRNGEREAYPKGYEKFRMLSRLLRTTKTCICGTVNHHIRLKDRVYNCSQCGYQNDRDIHSSYIINNTINYIGNENIEEACGIHTMDSKATPFDVILDSNSRKMITSMSTSYIKTLSFKSILESKLKSNKFDISFAKYRNTLEAPRLQAGVIH